MKKLILMIGAAIFLCGSSVGASAQNARHEIAVSYGTLSNSTWIDVFEDANIASTVQGIKFSDSKEIGSISAEYFYHINPLLGLGAIGSFGASSQDILSNQTKIGKMRHKFFTVMPAMKFNWLRRSQWGLYSKIGLGGTLRSEKDKFNDTSIYKDYDDNMFHFNWQVTFIGIEAGSESVRGFIETGVGEQGAFLVGVRYKF